MKRAATVGFLMTALLLWIAGSEATTYEVGDDQPYSSIGAVAWESLLPGDVVLIYWRPTPYHEKWVIGRTGTAASPLIVRGVPGPDGELPVVDGDNATTRLALDYWNEDRSVIKIGGSSIPADGMPRYIVVEGLDIRGARSPNSFTNDSGGTQTYAMNAAAVHVERGEHITIRDCILRDSGNGLFISSSDYEAASEMLIEGNYIVGNGNVGSIFEHNAYVAGIGMVFQHNRFGPLQSGAGGNNLKDRSAGLVVRYNWIEGGNRQLDLVDGEDSALIRSHPGYTTTHVYGNILIEPTGAGNKQIVHYGGDSSSTDVYRNGTLYFYHNTVVSLRTDTTTLFRLSTNSNHCDARNNIFYVATSGNGLAVLDSDGVLDLSHNWLKPGWRDSFGTVGGTINDDGTSIESASPGFKDFANQDYELAPGSVCVDAATSLPTAVLPEHDVIQEYLKHQSARMRVQSGIADDVGAFECFRVLDFHCDGDTDLRDLHVLVGCYSSPGVSPTPSMSMTAPQCLAIFDSDSDGDVDMMDFFALQASFSGP